MKKTVLYILGLVAVAAIFYAARGFYRRNLSVHELLTENKQLKEAITNLTSEEQIGYAKVVSQEVGEAGLLTTIKFVETARDDSTRKVLEKEYTIEGDIIHFDALIVKFEDKMVIDGRERALYLWRRVYAENTAPQDGLSIESPGGEPERYRGLLRLLPERAKDMFWSSIWDLANDPEKLRQYGIRAVYGNVVYSKLRPGLVYVFKITPAGQLHPEVILEM